MVCSRAALLALLAGCYSPRLREGAPCDSARQCPTPQSCVLGRCSVHPEPMDADIVTDATEERDAFVIDALIIDAHPDAALPCTAEGLNGCVTGNVFTCGGHCWVGCSNDTTWANASNACIGWHGTLGQIDDAAEQSCVASELRFNSWIDLTQSNTATAPDQDWVWNTGARPVVFTNWESGVPDDGDGSENRGEQCGYFQLDGRWDDISCTAQRQFACER